MSMGYFVLHYLGEMKLLSSKFEKLNTQENYKNDLKKLVDKHCKLLECHHILENTFGIFVLWAIIVCAINLCLTIYQITIVSYFFLYSKLIIIVKLKQIIFADD